MAPAKFGGNWANFGLHSAKFGLNSSKFGQIGRTRHDVARCWTSFDQVLPTSARRVEEIWPDFDRSVHTRPNLARCRPSLNRFRRSLHDFRKFGRSRPAESIHSGALIEQQSAAFVTLGKTQVEDGFGRQARGTRRPGYARSPFCSSRPLRTAVSPISMSGPLQENSPADVLIESWRHRREVVSCMRFLKDSATPLNEAEKAEGASGPERVGGRILHRERRWRSKGRREEAGWLVPASSSTPSVAFFGPLHASDMQSARVRPNLGGIRPSSGRTLPSPGRVRPTLGRRRPTSDRLPTNWGGIRPVVASRHADCTDSRQHPCQE